MQETGYLDFHTHTLPAVDDGSLDEEMTRGMLAALYEQGVRVVLATSHSYPDKKKITAQEQRLLTGKVDAMAKEIAPDFQVLVGNELYYRTSLVRELEQKDVLTLGDTNYVLVEFRPNERFERIWEAVCSLVEQGYYPVIAHVERVSELIGNKKNMKQLIEMSCYMQVNTGSLMGGFFNRQTRRLFSLMEENMIHFLGSDCHNMTTRPPLMGDCVKRLYKKLPQETVDRILIHNKEQFLQNKFL